MTGTSLFTPLLMLVWVTVSANPQAATELSFDQARWHPMHFKPAIDEATNEQCLDCHREVLDRRISEKSPAGVAAADALAWYQTLGTYEGAQETMHRRHLVTDYANMVMDMKCNTCHQGNDPREETAMSHADGDASLTQRKHVNPNICLMCHGRYTYENMGVPGPWPEFGAAFQDNCLLCHVTLRTNRHQVNFLKPDAIEALAKKDSDVCYGCHGGRAWYRIGFPYPRHPWPGMAKAAPDWAKDRPAESEARFLVGVSKPEAEQRPAQGGNR